MTSRATLAGLFLTLAVCSFCLPMTEQQHQHTELTDIGRLGAVSFPIACHPNSQVPFERGVALLHSFGYNAAQTQFQQIETEDPACAMAYWGEAMTLFRQLWDRPSKEDLQRGFELIEKARQIGAKTDRERGYIEAAAAFYGGGENANVRRQNGCLLTSSSALARAVS